MRNEKHGFVMLAMLVLTLVLFTLASLAFAANLRLHQQNKLMQKNLQQRAAGIRVSPGR